MKDSNLVKIALFVSFVGLILIWIYSGSLVLDYTPIADLNKKSIDDYVKIIGIIVSYQKNSKFLTIKINDETGSVDFILFDSIDIKPEKGAKLEVFGKISEYSGVNQIIANKVIFIAK